LDKHCKNINFQGKYETKYLINTTFWLSDFRTIFDQPNLQDIKETETGILL